MYKPSFLICFILLLVYSGCYRDQTVHGAPASVAEQPGAIVATGRVAGIDVKELSLNFDTALDSAERVATLLRAPATGFGEYSILVSPDGREALRQNLKSGELTHFTGGVATEVVLPAAYNTEDQDFLGLKSIGLIYFDRSEKNLWLRPTGTDAWQTIYYPPDDQLLNPRLIVGSPESKIAYVLLPRGGGPDSLLRIDVGSGAIKGIALPQLKYEQIAVSDGEDLLLIKHRKGLLFFDRELTPIDEVATEPIPHFQPDYRYRNDRLVAILFHSRHSLYQYIPTDRRIEVIARESEWSISSALYLNENQLLYGRHVWNTGRVFTDTTYVMASELVLLDIPPGDAGKVVRSGDGFITLRPGEEQSEILGIGRFGRGGTKWLRLRVE